MKSKKLSVKQIVLISFLSLFLIMFIIALIVRTSPSACEWWSRNIERGFINVSSFFSSFLPFSLMEVYFISLIVGIIVLLVLLIIDFKKKRKVNGVNKIGLIFTLLIGTVSTYYFVCGPSYGRDYVALPFYEEKVEQNEYEDILTYFTNDFNYCASKLSYKEDGDIISPYTLHELSQRVAKSYEILNDNDYFSSLNSRIKPMFTSFIYRELHITGVSFPISGEANVNYLCDTGSIAYTMAHELAHQKGVMREDEANQVALYVCLSSDDEFIRYSAYSCCYYSLIDLMNYTGVDGDYNRIAMTIDNSIWSYWDYSNKYWDTHNLAEKIGNFFNDIYLKINGTKGTETYVDDYVTPPEDSGEVGEQGEVIYNITFTPYQKLFFEKYYRDNK